ncbi:hypothetical protein V6N13_070957 [Hibiscus sabdariffa]
MPALFAANRFTIPIFSCTEGIRRFAAKSADRNRWRWTKREKRSGNPVDLLENRMPRTLRLAKLYGPARSPWPNPVITNHAFAFF